MSGDLVFYDVDSVNSNAFDPDAGYVAFSNNHPGALNITTARTFFLNAAKAKGVLRNKPDKKVKPKFGDWEVEIVNNHFPGNRNNTIGEDDLTLHRISGYLARWVLEEHSKDDESEKELIESTIVNPIAESNGIKWSDGAAIYLSFFPGTEMFLEPFKFFPLAIGIYRVKHKMMDAQFLKKALRQRYGKLTAEKWMATKVKSIGEAVRAVEKLKWGKGGISDAARTFLKKFDIALI
ncbi:N protein [Pongola virus - SAAr1]|uniref:Nucleoprotein n=2 Tax=Orthobunyavirus bwambaense TaxID=3052384 RepID=B3U4Y0_9VIRU|nr:N protein [Pongola virus - SAAr1]UZT55185.1 nucleocapsid [Pongola virus]AIN37036.1 nucleoprotein [Pongola virus - SAAr1]AIN37038.1 nucleoprotein [Pongola virus - SAAr1]UZT55188.1 nucleocapsid [Pongola virus]